MEEKNIEFTPERVNEVFENFFKAQGELINAMAFLKDLKLGIVKETWVTTRQATIKTGVPIRNIQNWIKAGKVRSRKIDKVHSEVILEDIEQHSHRAAERNI